MTIFQIVTASASATQEFTTTDPLAAFEVRGYRHTGRFAPDHLRVELRGQPKFEGLLGPMWGGDRDGVPVIRYEDQQTYDALSV